MKVDIYDLEDTPNFFLYCGIDRDNDKISVFPIYRDPRIIGDLYDYLATIKGQIGFNCMSYDGQLINYFLENEEEFRQLSPVEITDRMYKFSQRVIKIDKDKGDKYPYYTYFIPQLDLFRIYHFDNKHKTQNLKGLEFHLRFDNVEDMPFKYDHIVQPDEVQSYIDYCINDCRATKEFYLRSINKIELRKQLSKQYGLDLLNASDAKIGTEIVLDLYCKATGKRKNEVRKFRTYRNEIKLEDLIFPLFKS